MRDGWQQVTVGDVASVDDGAPVESPWEHELLTVRLHARGLVASGKRPNRTARGRKHFQRREGQILIGRQNYHRQCVGVVTPDLDGFVTSNAITALRPNELAARGFVELIMSTEHMAAEADKVMPGTGQREISQNALLALPVALPPLREQERIVDLIATLDTTIQAAEKEAEALERSWWAAMREIERACQLYPTRPLEEVATVRGGLTKNKKDALLDGARPVQYLRVANVRHRRLDLSEIATIECPDSRISKFLLHTGDLLMTEGGDRDKLGRGTVWRGELSECVNQNHVFVVRVTDEDTSPEFVSAWANGFGKRWFDVHCSKTTGIASISKTTLNRFPVPRAPKSTQVAWAAALDELTVLEDRVQEQVERLRALRANLLTVLLSGEHEIPESYDELMEAAS